MEALFRGTGSGELHLPYHLRVYKEYDLGMIKKRERKKEGKAALPEGEKYEVAFPSVLQIPGLGKVEVTLHPVKFCDDSQNIPEKTYTKWFDYDKISSVIVFRTRESGDYFMINKRLGRKTLQDYFVNEKVPRQERDRIYLLAEGAHEYGYPAIG